MSSISYASQNPDGRPPSSSAEHRELATRQVQFAHSNGVYNPLPWIAAAAGSMLGAVLSRIQEEQIQLDERLKQFEEERFSREDKVRDLVAEAHHPAPVTDPGSYL